MACRMDLCPVTTYCWWQTLEENFWQRELKQTWSSTENHIQGWAYIWYDTWKEILETGVRTKYSSSLIMTPGHSQTMQRQQEPPETCSSKTRSRHPTCWNIQIYRFRDFACNYCSLIQQSMNQLYRPYKYNETRRKAPGQHLTKLSQNPSLGKAFCVDVPKKPAKQGCKNVGVWVTNSLIDSLCIIL